ncbi:MAG: hypothetical protein ACYCW6_10860 [Candidatus Xenobia bacterium]
MRGRFAGEIFQLACYVILGAWIWVSTLLPHVAETVVGDRHIFAHTFVDQVWGLGFLGLLGAAAWYLWRRRQDRGIAAIFLIGIPVCGVLVLPQAFMERVEVTPTTIVHRREWSNRRFNADVALADVALAIKDDKGFRLVLKDRQVVELPGCECVAAAHDALVADFRQHSIPIRGR